MKKQILCLFLTLCMLLLLSCESAGTVSSVSTNNTSETVSETNMSNSSDEASEEISTYVPEEASTDVSGEVSEVSVYEYVWYGEEELKQWFEEEKQWSREHIAEDSILYSDDKHESLYFSGNGVVVASILEEKTGSNGLDNLMGIRSWSIANYCEYYGINKDEYVAKANEILNRSHKAPEGVKPEGIGFHAFQYDAIFSEKPWDAPAFIVPDYVPPEYDSYYTPIPEGDNHTSWYYYIDYRLIEHVGIPEFEAWLEAVPDSEQNIVAFVQRFGITEEIYKEVYSEFWIDWEMGDGSGEYRWIPYDIKYLYGTQEMQDLYFTVHPID